MALSNNAEWQGEFAESQAFLTDSLALARELGDAYHIARALKGLGYTEHHQGNLGRSQRLLEESLALFREIGDKRQIVGTLLNMAYIADLQGSV